MAKVDQHANGEPQPNIHRKLTEKQDKFIKAYIQTNNASEAYRQAYDCSNASVNTVCTSAYKLLAKPYIAHRIQQLRNEQAEKHDITVEFITDGYKEAARIAREQDNPTALTGAYTALGKLHGLITDKVDVTQKHSLSEEFEAFIRGLNSTPAPKTLDVVDVKAIEAE